MSNYTVIIYTPQELNHSSYIQTGLFELERMGFIDVNIRLSVRKNLGRIKVGERGTVEFTQQPFPKASFYKIQDKKTKKSITFAADLYDFANEFSLVAVQKCDYYFKRNYETVLITNLNSSYREKVIPLGLTFRVRPDRKLVTSKFKWGVILSNFILNIKFDSVFFKRLKKAYTINSNHLKKTKENRSIRRFEEYTNNFLGNTILFQTRCFLHENDKDVLQIHQQRYNTIKVLRKHFPGKFMGGFVPSKIANEKYSDALTNVPTAPEQYLDAMKKARIVIYTRGLANSPAWKMSEYLSQGKVIIAEPLTAELPVTLEEGKEVLFFKNNLELIEKINKVMNDKELAEKLSKNARAYFEAHIHPVQNTRRIIEFMLDKPLV